MYKVNLFGYCIAFFMRIGFIVGGMMGNIPMMLCFSVLAGLCVSPLTGDLNALIAATSDYTYRTKGKRIDGTMYSCTSLGIKLGGGIGIAITGWLLDLSGFDGALAVQSDSCIQMLDVYKRQGLRVPGNRSGCTYCRRRSYRSSK